VYPTLSSYSYLCIITYIKAQDNQLITNQLLRMHATDSRSNDGQGNLSRRVFNLNLYEHNYGCVFVYYTIYSVFVSIYAMFCRLRTEYKLENNYPLHIKKNASLQYPILLAIALVHLHYTTTRLPYRPIALLPCRPIAPRR
jgi:hypothetical protein